MRPLILLTNDDGVSSPGLSALRKAVEDLGEVWVVAPKRPMSCISHAISLLSPLKVEELGERTYAVDGTPADSVLVGLFGLLPRRPALVLSGINIGYNLGADVLYSGTVAGAREAALSGVPALAVSIERERGANNLATAAYWGRKVAGMLLRGELRGLLWNLNLPDLPPNEIKGLTYTFLGHRIYEDVVQRTEDGKFVIAGKASGNGPFGSDIWAVKEGFASLTPLSVDTTDWETLNGLAEGGKEAGGAP